MLVTADCSKTGITNPIDFVVNEGEGMYLLAVFGFVLCLNFTAKALVGNQLNIAQEMDYRQSYSMKSEKNCPE